MFLILVIIVEKIDYYINATKLLHYLGWESLPLDKTKQNESEKITVYGFSHMVVTILKAFQSY